jgi:amino-acid N-acetyltransferase
VLRSKFEVADGFGLLRVMGSVGPATAGDRTTIYGLLAEAGLPVDDLDTAPVRFWVARDAGEIVGAVGVEAYGTVGLLRSLVVLPARRGEGVGAAMVQALEGESCREGIDLLVLLTQTAQRFFAKQGYSVQGRHDVPASIQDTAEFRSLCPASAVCMSKGLVR